MTSSDHLDQLVATARAVTPTAPPGPRAAVLAALAGEPRAVTPIIPLTSRRPRPALVIAGVLVAAAAAAGLAVALRPAADTPTAPPGLGSHAAPPTAGSSAPPDRGPDHVAPPSHVGASAGSSAVPPSPVVGTAPPPQVVPPGALEDMRISGERGIKPDAETLAAMQRDGVTRVVVPVKVCIDPDGIVEQVNILKRSAYPTYDAAIAAGVWQWRYRPFEVDGRAVPVCAVVQFVFSLR